MKVKKAIIPAAGMGTRVLPASKAVPKEMLNIVDKPAIQYIVEEAFASGIEDVLIITNRGKGAIEDHYDHAFQVLAMLFSVQRALLAMSRLLFFTVMMLYFPKHLLQNSFAMLMRSMARVQ